VGFGVWCSCLFSVAASASAQGTVSVPPSCPLPIGESSSFEGWFGDPATQAGYRQTLSPTPPGVRLGGRRVIETDGNYDPANDTCWFPGSLIPQSYTLAGGSWIVAGDNTWGRDYVGWTDVSQYNYPISYYRSNNRAPCQTTIPQVMRIQCGTFSQPYYQEYITNSLQTGFNSTLIWSERLGVYRDRAY
jgi:hypothetical protein